MGTVVEFPERINVLTERVIANKERCRAAELCISSKRSRLATESWKETEGQPLIIRRAKLLKNILAGIPVTIREGELIVGNQTEFIRGANPMVDSEAANRIRPRLLKARVPVLSETTAGGITEEDRKSLLDDLNYWDGKTAGSQADETFKILWGDRWDVFTKQVRLIQTPAIPTAARTADWAAVINRGLKDIIAEIKEELGKLKTFDRDEIDKLYALQGMTIACEAVISYAGRYANLARQMAAHEKDEIRKAELEKIADICDRVPANPARSFHEALQSFFICFLAFNLEAAGSGETPGRMDQYLYPFWKKDIEEGKMTREEGGELLALLWVKLLEFQCFGDKDRNLTLQSSQNMNVTIGGVKDDGSDATNEMSFLILEMCRQLKPNQPHVSLRYHGGTNEELMLKAVETNIDHGGGMPAYFNDKVTLLSITQKGIPLSDARNWIPQGCVERTPGPTTGFFHAGPFFNMPKILEVTLNNGVDPRTGIKIGLETGDAREFKTFEQLYGAFQKQMCWFIDMFIEASNLWFGIKENNLAYPFNSALLVGCIKSGKDALAAGSKWGKEYMSVLRPFGHQNTVNSLAAMKKLVYEEKKITMDELLDALSKNFEGKEKLHALLLAAPKWGNDDDYVDDLMKDFFIFTGEYITSKKNHWGSPWLCSRQGLLLHFFYGQVDGALPDGKKAWIPLADASVSAFRGTDKKGPTAVYNSAAKVDQMEHTEATLLNLKFSPGPLQTIEGKRKFISMIKTYFDHYGHHVQFNILNAETLVDAKKHPEKYRDLVVRVAGFSAYFVDLGPDVQDEIIGRTMCSV